jgi:hypothetical protein
VRVGADAAADHDQPAAQRPLHGQVDLLGREQRVVALDDLDLVGVDEVVHPAVDDEEGVLRPHRPAVHDQRWFHAHLVGELDRGALGDLGVRALTADGQREAHLHHAVAAGVAVRSEQFALAPLGRARRARIGSSSLVARSQARSAPQSRRSGAPSRRILLGHRASSSSSVAGLK